jgi:hypothetical protein
MTVTTDRLAAIVEVGERFDLAGFKLKRLPADADDEQRELVQGEYDEALQAVVDLTIDESEVAEIEASYNRAMDAYREDPAMVEDYRARARALTFARRGNRLWREATGERVPGVSVTEG